MNCRELDMKSFFCAMLAIICVSSHCVSQIVTRPTLSFERLTWGDSLESVKTLLPGRISNVRDTVDTERARSYSYEDTIESRKVSVTLRFADDGRRLVAILLFCFGNRQNGQIADSVASRDVEQLWDWFSIRYGPFSTEKNGFFGLSRKWLFPQTTIQMILVRKDSGLLTVIYSNGRLLPGSGY
jgi:hypothetical protein